MIYDALTTRYTFSCPERGEARIAFSSFRRVEQLPGPTHPTVFGVSFDCGCGAEHPGLVSHDELDWAPLGLAEGLFHDLMTSRLAPVEDELADLAARRIQAGEWPWSFFCYPEERPRPVFPSSFVLLAPAEGTEAVGVAIRCPVCSSVSINVVTAEHLDVPFHNDAEIGVVEHVLVSDTAQTLEEFRARLYSSDFDARRLLLE